MDEEIEKLLKKNYALTKEISFMVKDIRRYIRWQKFWGWVKFFVIVVPIILTLVYLPSFISSYLKEYQNLLGGNPSAVNSLLKGTGAVDLNNVPPELQKYLK
jgi:hypothetical protein